MHVPLPQRSQQRWIIAVSIILLAAVPSLAQKPIGRGDPATVENWQQRLRTYDEMLKAGDHRTAGKRLDRLLMEMCDSIEGGEGAAPILSMAVLLRAVSQAGRGEMAEAVWDLEIAYSLLSAMRDADLAVYGEAGEKLAAALETEAIRAKARFMFPGDPKVTPPRKVKSPTPKYPVAKVHACIDGPIVVQAVIDEDGKPHHPKLISTAYPVLGFAALDSLRDWRFEPAQIDGQKSVVFYNLQVNYRIPICRNPFAIKEQGEG